MNLPKCTKTLLNVTRLTARKVMLFCALTSILLLSNSARSQAKINPEMDYFNELRKTADNDPKFFKPIVEKTRTYYKKLPLTAKQLHTRLLTNCRSLEGDPEGYIIHSIVVFEMMHKVNDRYAMAEMVHHIEEYVGKIENLYLKTFTENNIAIYCSMLNKYDEEVVHLMKALEYAKRNRDTLNIQIVQGNIGHNYFYSKDYKKSEYFVQRAISWEKYGYISGYVSRRNALATIYTFLEEREMQALKIYESIQDCTGFDPGVISFGIGQLHIKLQNQDKALEYFLRAEREYKVGHSNLEALYNDLATCYGQLNNFERAYHYVRLRDSLRIDQNKLQFSAQYEELKRKNAKKVAMLKVENANAKLLLESGKTTQLFFVLIIVFGVLVATLLGIAFQRKKIRALVQLNLVDLKKKDIRDTANSERVISNDLINSLVECVEKKEIFKDAEISLWKLSKLLESNTNDVSMAINSFYGMSFRTLINKKRVGLAKQLLLNEEYSRYSIAGIAEIVGYQNKSSFYKNFKDITGVTPSIFQRIGNKLIESNVEFETEEE